VTRAVFLDRDGVLNHAFVRNGTPHPPDSVEDLEILPGVPEACRKLRRAGFRLVVVTNQPDVARGMQSREVVDAIHLELRRQVPVDEIRVCCHGDSDRCACRKPGPGMLMAAAEASDIDLAASFMVGDRWRDIEAGERAGCRTVWIDRQYAEQVPESPDHRAASLEEAADWIVRQTRVEQE
jgi:D-glycero-D-manno-heptose 1,7-bisphosphate phosphatase